jgi:hypothetical protein
LIADNVGTGGGLTVGKVMGGVAAGDMAQLMASMQQFQAVQSADDAQLRVKATLNAMNQLAHYLAGIPGRKNLIWFAGSFPLDLLAQSQGEFRETADLLARSRIAIYPVGAHGLTTNAAAISNDTGGSAQGRGLARAQGQFSQNNADQSITMTRVATDTGGVAYLDTNGLSEAVGKAIENGSSYYTFAYKPTATRQDGEFRKIQVKLAQQGLTLSYRSGYYTDDATRLKTSKIIVSLPMVGYALGSDSIDRTTGPANALTRTMMRGAPDATEILIKLQVRPANNATESAVAKDNIVNPNPAAKLQVKGPFRRYAIDIAADAKDVRITPTPDGHYQFSTELITYVYDATGTVVNTAVQREHSNLTVSSYANMRVVGLRFHQEISVPANGEHYLRTSLHDLETDRYGSVEIPVASVAKLTPLAAAATTDPATPTKAPK